MITRLAGAAFAAAAVLTIACRPALALQCAPPKLVAPANGESDVPVNAKIWLGYYWPEQGVTIQLTGPEGPIEVDRRAVTIGSLAAEVVVARQELRPRTRYQLEVTCQKGVCPTNTSFTTGVERAVKVPLPVLLKQTPLAEQRGGYSARSVLFQFEDVPEALLVVAEFVGQKPVRTDDAESFFEGPWFRAPQMAIGVGTCATPTRMPPPGDTHQVRFGQVDIAGNFSGWTTPVRFTLPDAPGCSVGAAPAGGWSLPAMALAVLLARRRRRP